MLLVVCTPMALACRFLQDSFPLFIVRLFFDRVDSAGRRMRLESDDRFC
jgi:hypothetical protein